MKLMKRVLVRYSEAFKQEVVAEIKMSLIDRKFKNKTPAIKTVHQSIYIYNTHRPHWSINLKTPNVMHAA